MAARCLRNDKVLSPLVERVWKAFAILISIEPLGCSTAVVFFVGFSMSKNSALHRNGQISISGAKEIYTPRGD